MFKNEGEYSQSEIIEVLGVNKPVSTHAPYTKPENPDPTPPIQESHISKPFGHRNQHQTQTRNTDTELADYHAAFEQEFTKSSKGTVKALNNVDGIFTANAEDIAQRLVSLAVGARAEATRLKAASYIIDYLNNKNNGDVADPFQRLIDKLTDESEAAEAELPTVEQAE